MASNPGGATGVLTPFVDHPTKRNRFSVTIPVPEPLPEITGLLAGAADVDITPPPGMPKAGYSANAHDGTGFRTRLRARITHLRSGRASIAIVALDLLGGSSVLQHLIAQEIAERTDIPLAGLWIGATHTHAGPGQFLGTDFYNHHASNRAGFDPSWTRFLVERISAGIVEAHDRRVPARAAFGTREVWGLTRNRSHDPYTHNTTVTDKRRDPQRKWVAVNPRIQLLRVDRIDDGGVTRPLSANVVFSIHGTGISMKAREYNADVWAYLTGSLRHAIAVNHDAPGVVVGAMEGTHADVAPALRPGMAGHREAKRIGTGIGAQAAELYEELSTSLTDDLVLDAGLSEVDLDRNRSIDGIELPDRPAVGAALVAGAAENLTPIVNRIPPFKAGSPKRFGTDNAHGGKWVIGSRWLQPLVLPKGGFPRQLAVQVLRVGDTALVGLPFEITVESGRRIEAAVAGAVGDAGVDRVVVSSVANEYWGYVATEEEYRRQFYEGGHTLYGPNTLRFLAAHARRVAEATVGHGTFHDVGPSRSWNLASRRFHLHPDPESVVPDRHFVGRAAFVDPTAETDGYWEQVWLDVDPGRLRWHEPIVTVESSDDDGETWQPAVDAAGMPADDQGWGCEVTHLGTDARDRHRYRVRWFDPNHRAGRRHRFVLLANGEREHVPGPSFD
jgi:neutral ceramidase